MSSIVTITFSPCIDKSTSVPKLIPEKKLSCTVPVLEPGGGGINVARALKKLGGNAVAIFPSGGYTGKCFNQLMLQEGISSIIIETGNETRENITVTEVCSANQYRLGMPGTLLNESEWKQCLNEVEKINDVRFIVASGSLPPGVPPGIYRSLAKIAKTKNAKLIVDTSGEALIEAANEGVYLLKPNLGELSKLAGKNELSIDQVTDTARKFTSSGKCEAMIVSMGAAGAMLITNDLSEMITPPPVAKKSTVGAGDSMVAGITLSLLNGKKLIEAALYGVACGTAATMNPGTELCRKEDADNLYRLLQKSHQSQTNDK